MRIQLLGEVERTLTPSAIDLVWLPSPSSYTQPALWEPCKDARWLTFRNVEFNTYQ